MRNSLWALLGVVLVWVTTPADAQAAGRARKLDWQPLASLTYDPTDVGQGPLVSDPMNRRPRVGATQTYYRKFRMTGAQGAALEFVNFGQDLGPEFKLDDRHLQPYFLRDSGQPGDVRLYTDLNDLEGLRSVVIGTDDGQGVIRLRPGIAAQVADLLTEPMEMCFQREWSFPWGCEMEIRRLQIHAFRFLSVSGSKPKVLGERRDHNALEP